MNPASLPLHRSRHYSLPTAFFHSKTAHDNRLKEVTKYVSQLQLETSKLDPELTSRKGQITPDNKLDGIFSRISLTSPLTAGLYPLFLLTGWGTKKEFQAWHRYAKVKSIDEVVFQKSSEDKQPYGAIIKDHVLRNDAKAFTKWHFKKAYDSLAKWEDAKTIHGKDSSLFPDPTLFKIPFLFGKKVLLLVTNSTAEAGELLKKSRIHNPPSIQAYQERYSEPPSHHIHHTTKKDGNAKLNFTKID